MISNYQIIKSIGKGGMGEVFLARDPLCGRDVALKQMQDKWRDNKVMQERFFREAKIAAQLSHPNIIAIYTISETYYTMPYIEGETLKEILRKTREQHKLGEPLHPIGSSIPSLVRIFLSVCGAVAYTHSRGVIHRDLKPENIIVGKFGEVIILDWGLADFIDHPEKNGLDFEEENSDLTQPGKIPGTLLYMAPERAFGAQSTTSTDIYSLGVMLYQILTLHFPFQRPSLKEFKKTFEHEKILDPEEVSPDREISPHLSNIAKKCLEKKTEDRFQSVSDIIRELENYIEGTPEWKEGFRLSIDKNEDWVFQENVALAKDIALTREVEHIEWFNLMVSKLQFTGNLKIEFSLSLSENTKGLGILFSVPENNLHKAASQSYLLWISEQTIKLYRSNVEVFSSSEIVFKLNEPYTIGITVIANNIKFFMNGIQKWGFLSHIPLSGSRIGLLMKDRNFILENLQVSIGSQNILVNCLAIPDAFSARKLWNDAIKEYQKIALSFPGRAEGREAHFRAGLTLLKQAEGQKKQKKETLYTEAFDEFEKLHNTPGAPLEYLGKSLVYKAQGDFEEEAKYLELALRKYPTHPLKSILIDNILTRFHEASQNSRKAAYSFSLILLRHLPHLQEATTLSDILEKYLEPLPFFVSSSNRITHLIIQLAFWLNKPLVFLELIEKGELHSSDLQNAKIALLLLGNENLTEHSILDISPYGQFEFALKNGTTLPEGPFALWEALLEKNWIKARELVGKIHMDLFIKEEDPHFFLYGCFLAHEEGKKSGVDHLTNISEKAFPKIYTLLSHYLLGRITIKSGWIKQAFFWEKLKLCEQLELFEECVADKKLKTKIKNDVKKIKKLL